MRALAVLSLLALLSAAFAYRVDPVTITPFEYKDFGNASLPKFDDMEIIVDCNAATIRTHIASSGTAVQGASTYLKYVDYYVPLLSSDQTDSSGDVLHKIPSGNISHMTGLFVLTAEKSGYQRREAHFELGDCFVSAPAQPPSPPPPQQNATPPPQQNASPPPPPPLPQDNTSQPIAPPPNISGNATGSQPPSGSQAGGKMCPLGAGLMALLAISLFAIGGPRHAD